MGNGDYQKKLAIAILIGNSAHDSSTVRIAGIVPMDYSYPKTAP